MASESQAPSISLEQPRMEDRKTLLVAGLMKTYTPATANEIPLLWRELTPYFGKIPGQVDHKGYGVIYNMKKPEFAYLAGVEVSSASDVPDELNVVRIPDMTYAIFPHQGHVSTLKDTISAIWSEWLPASGLGVVQVDEEMPGLLEQYGEAFDPATGTGDIEIWVPLKNRSTTITVEPSPTA
ncbi:MAG TPA: GyrI-like domain-containing protein [Bryobacteraceae bacterium]|nr:GyrI-like domain-containing protein [Bryobacteraceae bacterium]